MQTAQRGKQQIIIQLPANIIPKHQVHNIVETTQKKAWFILRTQYLS